MANKRYSTKGRVGKHTLLVIGSLTLRGSSSSEEEDEKVTAITVNFSSPKPTPSSSTHLCLMAKGERKVQNDDTSDVDCGSDSYDEYASPTYDELADFLKEYTQVIRKSKAKCDKIKDENKSLIAKYDIVVKVSDEMKEENITMSSTSNELKASLEAAKEKYEKFNEENRELNDRLVKIKEDYTKIKIDHDNILVAYELLSCDTHEDINPIVKLHVATSCDDLSTVDQSSHHGDLVEKT
jgi:tRNA/tmRNA/rRNA uracil-C5-methylase (TrmA/RlmC/RlmD family)